MIKFLILAILMCSQAQAVEFDVDKFLNKSYLKVGTGYKLIKKPLTFNDGTDNSSKKHAISARFELGYRLSENVTIGVSHYSQWLVGWPINDKKEYSTTGIFIDYTFEFKRLK